MNQTIYVSYYDSINEQKAKALMALCADIIAQHRPSKLYFLISSTGGSVDAGVALYNYFRALPVPIVMHNTGSIDSIANVIFLAADERYANPNASFLLHGIKWNFNQGASLSWTALQETVSRFKADEARMSGIITARTAILSDELMDLFRQGDSVGLAFAKDKGLIHEIREAKVPVGVPFISCNFA
ncbi:MAG: ATP-dependent Clp protease proteolytic subunit [bacterium]|jgi:ATP-dependent protease ClpP protease subunit